MFRVPQHAANSVHSYSGTLRENCEERTKTLNVKSTDTGAKLESFPVYPSKVCLSYGTYYEIRLLCYSLHEDKRLPTPAFCGLSSGVVQNRDEVKPRTGQLG